MRIRPLDLREPRFRAAFRGVSRREVRELLGALATDLEATMAEIESLRAALAAVGSRLLSARDQDTEATRLLSQAEADGRRMREAAERLAAEAIAAAEVRTAALVDELEAERALLLDRIAQCVDHQRRIATVLQNEVNDLHGFLTSEPALQASSVAAAAGTAADPPAAIDRPDDDSAWSAADVQRALAEATAKRQAAGAEADPAATKAGRAAASSDRPAWALLKRAADWLRRLSLPRFPLQGRGVAAGLGAVLIMVALTSPGGPPAPSGMAAAGLTGRTAKTPAPSPRSGTKAPAGPDLPAMEPVAPAPAGPPPAAPDGTMRVKIEAVRPCWIRLSLNGRSEEHVLQAGEALVRDSTTDLVVRAGNAGALVVTVDGRTIPPLGREGEIVTRRLTRSTPGP